MTRGEILAFMNGDTAARYDGERYYFDCVDGDGALVMREINTDYMHRVPDWRRALKSRAYTAIGW